MQPSAVGVRCGPFAGPQLSCAESQLPASRGKNWKLQIVPNFQGIHLRGRLLRSPDRADSKDIRISSKMDRGSKSCQKLRAILEFPFRPGNNSTGQNQTVLKRPRVPTGKRRDFRRLFHLLHLCKIDILTARSGKSIASTASNAAIVRNPEVSRRSRQFALHAFGSGLQKEVTCKPKE